MRGQLAQLGLNGASQQSVDTFCGMESVVPEESCRLLAFAEACDIVEPKLQWRIQDLVEPCMGVERYDSGGWIPSFKFGNVIGKGVIALQDVRVQGWNSGGVADVTGSPLYWRDVDEQVCFKSVILSFLHTLEHRRHLGVPKCGEVGYAGVKSRVTRIVNANPPCSESFSRWVGDKFRRVSLPLGDLIHKRNGDVAMER